MDSLTLTIITLTVITHTIHSEKLTNWQQRRKQESQKYFISRLWSSNIGKLILQLKIERLYVE